MIRIRIRMWIRTKMSLIYNTSLEQHIKNVDYCRNLTITAVRVHQSNSYVLSLTFLNKVLFYATKMASFPTVSRYIKYSSLHSHPRHAMSK